ncbi:AbrB/MazE/SpoVT family DNA-binding domain-containing protein [Candidatus Micrarchaeota archaeon]|nr:AbrB/MazE/SpoVT family DNA-binding domain-containing protein [Candidatus Micrarchaeota archaeon]
MYFTTVTLSDKGQISIPKKVRQDLGLKKGEQLVLREDGGRIVLEPAAHLMRRLELVERSESLTSMLVSEQTLAKDWSNEDDERWNAI